MNGTFERPHRPPKVRIYNSVGRLIDLCGVNKPLPLCEEAMMSTARRLTGLGEWKDQSFRVPLRKLLESLERDPHLTLWGRLRARNACIASLVNRLRIEAELCAHPEILRVPVERPLMIAGLPRTGSTLLQNLLALDPARRSLRFWELAAPAPAPDPETARSDPRREAADRWVNEFYYVAPQMRIAHRIAIDEPDEDHRLFHNAFMSMIFESRFNVVGYADWLESQDMRPAYSYYRTQLQLLMWHWPGRPLSAKDVYHNWHMEALLSTFPDACLVQIHRDPLDVLPAYCSMSAIIRSISTDHLDLHEIGRFWSRKFELGLKRMMAARTPERKKNFHDLPYGDLVRDPVVAVRRIYEDFGFQFHPQFEQNITRYMAQSGGPGRHYYSLEQFGLDRQATERQLAFYREAFILPQQRSLR